MLEFLKKICKISLWGLLVLFLGAGLLLFVWWMGWPLFTVAVGIGVAGMVVLLFMAIRQIRIWLNKRRYVHHVLTNDPSLRPAEKTEIGESPMHLAWERGMSMFARSPRSRRENPFYSQPWGLLFGSEPSLEASPPAGEPLRWHFLPDMVLLEISEAFLDPSPSAETRTAWEYFLSRLLEVRAKEPPESVLATVDAKALASGDTDALRRRARQLHARIRELLALYEARLPLYVTVTGLETVPGMRDLLDTLPDAERSRPLGECFPLPHDEAVCPLSPETCASRSVEQAVRRLRRVLITRAGEGAPPDGDDLSALSGLAGLEPGLAVFLEPLFRGTPHAAAPLLRGVLFTAGASSLDAPACPVPPSAPARPISAPAALLADTLILEPLPVKDAGHDETPPSQLTVAPKSAHPEPKIQADIKACFTDELFSRILPGERPVRLHARNASLRERLTAIAFGGWYLALFVFCGLVAANTVYHWHSLRDAPAAAASPDRLTDAENTFRRMRHFEDADRRWWLPTLGLGRIGGEREKAKARFVGDMRELLPPALSSLSPVRTTRAPGKPDARQMERMQRLLWMSEAVDLRRRTGTADAMREQPFPATSADESGIWSLAFGDSFLAYLDREDDAALPSLTASLRNALRQNMGGNEARLFDQIVGITDETLSYRAVTLAEFWPNVPRGGRGFLAVRPSFTAAGYAELTRRMERLYADATGDSYTDKPFWRQYLADYADAWRTFAMNADRAWRDVDQVFTLENLTAEPEMVKTPSVRLLARMAAELRPLSANAPEWVNDVFLLNALTEASALSGDTDPGEKLGTLSILLGGLKTSDTALAQVRDYLLRTRDLRGLFRAVSALREYEQSLIELRQTMLSPEGSFTLAAIHYGGKQYGDAAQSAFSRAETQLQDAFRVLHVRPEQGRARAGQTQSAETSPAAVLLRGQLRLFAHAVVTKAAMELQRQWESNVLAASLMSQAPGPLFADQGVANLFLTERAAPFLNRQVGGYLSQNWNGEIFPFTEDFLTYIQQGQVASLITPKESYAVRLRSQTPSVNRDATERLQFLELSLAGEEGPTVLKNQNYPVEKTFTYKPSTSGGVTLRFNFPSLTLSVSYPSFPDFLRDFAYGERVFGIQNFPDSAERMEALNIRSITVRILPSNAGEVLAAEAAQPMPLPERIVKVW